MISCKLLLEYRDIFPHNHPKLKTNYTLQLNAYGTVTRSARNSKVALSFLNLAGYVCHN